VAQNLKNYFQFVQAHALSEGQEHVNSLVQQYSWLQLSWLLTYAKLSANQIFDDKIRILNEVIDLSCSLELRHGSGNGWRALKILCYSLVLTLARSMIGYYDPRRLKRIRRSLNKSVASLDSKCYLRKAVSAVVSGNDEFSEFLYIKMNCNIESKRPQRRTPGAPGKAGKTLRGESPLLGKA